MYKLHFTDPWSRQKSFCDSLYSCVCVYIYIYTHIYVVKNGLNYTIKTRSDIGKGIVERIAEIFLQITFFPV